MIEENQDHMWRKREHDTFECCGLCGNIKRKDGENKPCKGPVKVGIRSTEMDNWIKEFENNASKHDLLKKHKGALFEKYLQVYYPNLNGNISLHGEFTIKELTALINHMKKYNKE